MNKVINIEKIEEELFFCSKCIKECGVENIRPMTYRENDIDGFWECLECGKTDIQGHIDTIKYNMSYTKTITIEISKKTFNKI